MRQITASLALALAAVATGCGGAQRTNRHAATCADAAANVEKAMNAVGDQQGLDMHAIATVGHDVGAERCAADGWSEEAIACVSTATHDQMEGCMNKLTAKQNQALQDEMKAKVNAAVVEDGKASGSPARARAPHDPCSGDD